LAGAQPLEMADNLPGMVGIDSDEEVEGAKFRYGEIEFEESGNRVPYLIIPATDEGKDPKKIIEYMRTHLKFQGKELTKPNIAFGVRARGQSYLEWAKDIYDNPFLVQMWNWRTVHAAGIEEEVLREHLDDKAALIEMIIKHEAALEQELHDHHVDHRAAQDDAVLRTELEALSTLNVRRRAQEGKLIPAHKQFRPTGPNGRLEPIDMDKEFPGHHTIERVTLDNAIREFGDKVISVFRDVVKGVVNSDGWFLFPAGRRPRHQLIGDTIYKYGGELNDCVMVQYNSLQNPNLLCRGSGPDDPNARDHDEFVGILKERSVELQPFSKVSRLTRLRAATLSYSSLDRTCERVQQLAACGVVCGHARAACSRLPVALMSLLFSLRACVRNAGDAHGQGARPLSVRRRHLP
jgi:hypothetical protein